MKLVILMVFILLMGGCGSSEGGNDSDLTHVSVSEANELIVDGDVTVIDVRTYEEFEDFSLGGSKLIPLQEIRDRYTELEESNSYLIVCRTGNRSEEAAMFLEEQGFTEIYNLRGGVFDLID